MKLDSLITLRAIYRTSSLLINLASLVSASTSLIVNNALFTRDLTNLIICLPQQILQNSSSSSGLACAYFCSKRQRCRGFAYLYGFRECFACNGTTSAVEIGIGPVPEVVYYRKESPEENAGKCLGNWVTRGMCVKYRNFQGSVDWNTAVALCSSQNASLLQINTVREQDQRIHFIYGEDTGFWTSAKWYENHGWYWSPEATSKVLDDLWANGANGKIASERSDVAEEDQRGCMLAENGHKLSVCSQHERMRYTCQQ